MIFLNHTSLRLLAHNRFLNAFWAHVNDQAEKIWLYKVACEELDDKKAEGCTLDEMQVRDF